MKDQVDLDSFADQEALEAHLGDISSLYADKPVPSGNDITGYTGFDTQSFNYSMYQHESNEILMFNIGDMIIRASKDGVVDADGNEVDRTISELLDDISRRVSAQDAVTKLYSQEVSDYIGDSASTYGTYQSLFVGKDIADLLHRLKIKMKVKR